MNIAARFPRRDSAEVEPSAETRGQIRPLIEESDGDAAAAEVHRVELDHAKPYYHEKTDEIHYVIEGEGKMVLDGEEIEPREGVVVYVHRGVLHDVHELE